jgi:hypothetical protein
MSETDLFLCEVLVLILMERDSCAKKRLGTVQQAGQKLCMNGT